MRSDLTGALIRLSNTLITNNTGNGLLSNGGGLIVSFGNNSVGGNGVADGTPTSTVPQI